MKKIAFFSFIAFFFACSGNVVFDQSEEIPNNGWNMQQAARFVVDIDDASKAYSLYVKVDNGQFYPYSNLWIFCRTASPQGKVELDTLEVTLADAEGRWQGEKDGESFSALYPFKKGVRFPAPGKYEFLLAQGMRDTILEDVRKVGLMVEKSEK